MANKYRLELVKGEYLLTLPPSLGQKLPREDRRWDTMRRCWRLAATRESMQLIVSHFGVEVCQALLEQLEELGWKRVFSLMETKVLCDGSYDLSEKLSRALDRVAVLEDSLTCSRRDNASLSLCLASARRDKKRLEVIIRGLERSGVLRPPSGKKASLQQVSQHFGRDRFWRGKRS